MSLFASPPQVSRAFLLLGSVILAGAAHAQDANRKVTFSMPAGRASVVLAALGPQVGLNLSTSTQMEGENLLIKVKDVSLRDLLARIAEASDGDWRQEQNGLRLVRSSDSWKRIEREELKSRSEEIAGVLGSYRDRVAKLPAFDEAEAKRLAKAQQDMMNSLMSKMNSQGGGPITLRPNAGAQPEASPGGRALVALLSAIGSNELAKIPQGQRTVWSTTPNRMQLPLGGNATAVLQKFIRDQQLYSRAAQKAQPADDTRQIRVMGIGGDTGPGNPALGIGKAILVADRFGPSLRCQLAVADPNGDAIGSATFVLPSVLAGSSDKSEGEKITPSALTEELAKLLKSEPVVLNGATAVRRLAISSVGGNVMTFGGSNDTKPVAISADLRARLRQPESYDPLSLAPTEAFVGAADQFGKNLVACLPDTSLVPLTQAITSGLTPSKLLASAAERSKIQVSKPDGWIVARPSMPYTARKERIDRVAMGKLVRAIDDQGYAHLSDLAAYAVVTPKGVVSGDPAWVAIRFVNSTAAGDALNYLSQPNVLRLYASLGRDFLRSGGTVALAALTPTQLELVAQEVYQSPFGPQILSLENFRPTMVNTVNTERTELLPNGLPRDGTFTLRVDAQPAALGIDAAGATSLVTPDALAMRMLQNERTDLAFFGPVTKLEHFLPAAQTNLTLSFQFSPHAGLQRQLADTVFDSHGAKVAYSGLPAEMRSRTEQTLANLRNNFKGTTGVRPGPARNGIPPSP